MSRFYLPTKIQDKLLIVAALIMTAGMHLYFRNVIIPAQEADAVANNKPRGNISDLYPRWLGAREVLLHNRDPYTKEFAAESQLGYWGRRIDPDNPNDPKDQAGFAYPLYVVFLLAPTITMTFESVQRLYWAIGVALCIASAWFWSRAFGISRRNVTAVAAILMLGCYPVVQALFLEQPVLVVAGLIAAAVAATRAGMLSAAGILLALAMIKPQTAGPIAAWLLLWALSHWTSRKALAISFSASMILMWAGAELLLPGWIGKWRGATAFYLEYNDTVPAHVQLLFGTHAGILVGFIMSAAVAVLCWNARKDSPSSDRFMLISVLILVVNLAVTPIWHEYDQMFVVPAVMLIYHWRVEFWRLHPLAQVMVGLSAIAFLWHWVVAILLVGMSLALPIVVPHKWQILPWLPVFFAPTLVLASLALIARSRLSVGADATHSGAAHSTSLASPRQ
jgi:hypothetical protein